ncbi:YceI family protein [Yinghuangia soli]|uniref:YceI family protein n=1 Tax=Yinghuangia soli TaxID=2908204 RepID=A0AA41Q5N1_9ACTN|nr:YceI family protein [Yinghuangia soli]MCF2530829.1 YceI family protein [Yinghuangia soli]
MSDTAIPLSELTGSYTIDPAHTRIGFSARHAMITKVRGAFNDFTGTAYLDGDDPTKSSASVTIQAVSIDTRNEQRDGHLRTNDFLDAPNFPEITFSSTGVERLGDTTYRLIGDLTIKGVPRPISVDFEFEGAARDPYGNVRVGFEGSVVISRKEYGMTWNATLETGGVLVSDKVTLEIEVSAVKDA